MQIPYSLTVSPWKQQEREEIQTAKRLIIILKVLLRPLVLVKKKLSLDLFSLNDLFCRRFIDL